MASTSSPTARSASSALPPENDAATGLTELPPFLRDDEIVSSAAISSGGRKLVIDVTRPSQTVAPPGRSPSQEQALTIIDLSTGKRLDCQPAAVGSIVAEPEGRYFAVASGGHGDQDAVAAIYKMSGELRFRLGCSSRDFAFLPPDWDETNLLFLSETDGLVLYPTDGAPFTVNGLVGPGRLSVSPSNDLVTVADYAGHLYVWNASQLDPRLDRDVSPGPARRILVPGQISAIAWLSRDRTTERFLATALAQGGCNDIVIWDVQTGKPLTRLAGHAAKIVSLYCDGRFLYSSSDDDALIAWDVRELLEWCEAKTR